MNILKYGEGVAFLESNEGILGLELYITSQMQSESLLDSGFLFAGHKDKIVIASLNGESLDNKELFKYEGTLKINNIIAGIMLNGKAVKVNVSAQSSEVDMLINNTSTLITDSNIDMEINENIPRSPVRVKKPQVCITNNLSTEGGEFYFKNGSEYLGEYHLYGNLQAMTGSTRSDSSEFIYRKDALDRLEAPSKREEFEIKPIIKKAKSGTTEEPLVETTTRRATTVKPKTKKSIIKPKAPKKRIVKGGKY